jgi:hypothetical protein
MTATCVRQGWSEYGCSLRANMEGKLTAILTADVHGYSRLMDEDEEA